jgi:hypothetical protein
VSNKQRTAEQGWRSKVIKKLLQKEQNWTDPFFPRGVFLYRGHPWTLCNGLLIYPNDLPASNWSIKPHPTESVTHRD